MRWVGGSKRVRDRKEMRGMRRGEKGEREERSEWEEGGEREWGGYLQTFLAATAAPGGQTTPWAPGSCCNMTR